MPILKGTEEPHDPVCFKEDGSRLDGRALDEIRSFSCEVGVIKNAQGSALVRHGGNQIYAAVYGPREVHPRHMAKPDRGILRVYYRMCTFSVHERKSPAPNRRENEISKVIREALEPVLFLEAYPDSQIEIYIEVVAADGGTRCASTTAASLALADAGIPMKSLVVGVAAGKAQDKVILDLGDKEDKVGQADVPAVVVMKDKTISLLQFDGEMTAEEMELGFKYILKGAEDIYQKQLEALKSKYMQISDEVKIENVEVAKHTSAVPETKEASSEAVPATPKAPVDVPAEKQGESSEKVPETPVSEASAPETPAPEAPKQGDDN
ncbi:Ribonuclease PH [Candidatus Lokiarchaeum ossiferum]|uniref:Ribonuclease PH n=1 Tax=Candidatus Lokiarchaeum ossiferum TaxID=2951803 RepID=A0ABY6HS78_9ARCH|nr:Ribonuclease PH [Candidatus Lokiarchaeum sp. B-35]